MNNFICHKCGNHFNKKYNLNRHLNRLIDCVSGSKTKREYSKYSCKYCDRGFTRKDSFDRHVSPCKKKYISKKKKLDNKKITNNGNKNVLNNGNHNHSIVTYKSPNSNNNTIVNLVVFPKEDITKLDYIDLKKLFNTKENLIQALTKTINFNPHKPENHNILYSDLKSTYGEVFQDDKWVKRKIDEILDILIDARVDNFNNILNDMGNFLSEKTQQKIQDTIENFDYSKPNYRKRLKVYLKPIIYNHRDMILKTKKLSVTKK